MNKLVVSVFITCAIAISLGLDCSNIVTNESQGLLNWLGGINWTAPVSSGDSGWTLTLSFDQNFTGVGVWHAVVTYNGTEKWAEISNQEGDEIIDAGDKRYQRFRVNYGLNIPVPQVVSIRFQDIELCN